MKIGDRIKFVGPEYKHYPNGTRIGTQGVITARDGHGMSGIDEDGGLLP